MNEDLFPCAGSRLGKTDTMSRCWNDSPPTLILLMLPSSECQRDPMNPYTVRFRASGFVVNIALCCHATNNKQQQEVTLITCRAPTDLCDLAANTCAVAGLTRQAASDLHTSALGPVWGQDTIRGEASRKHRRCSSPLRYFRVCVGSGRRESGRACSDRSRNLNHSRSFHHPRVFYVNVAFYHDFGCTQTKLLPCSTPDFPFLAPIRRRESTGQYR